MKPFRKIAAGLFGFDRRERRGTYVLSVLLIIFLLVRLTAFSPGKVPEDLCEIPLPDEFRQASDEDEVTAATLFTFDPNTVKYDDLLLLGLSERQAGTLAKYREAGAKFRRPGDLKRVYGIDSITAARLIPYVEIESEAPVGVAGGGMSRESKAGPAGGGISRTTGKTIGDTRGEVRYTEGVPVAGGVPRQAGGVPRQAGGMFPRAGGEGVPGDERHRTAETVVTGGELQRDAASEVPGDRPPRTGEAAGRYSKRAPRSVIDLNSCTAGDLVSLPGIGPVLSERIVKYRSLLGGFVDKQQLREVYGLDTAVVNLIAPMVTLTLDSVKPLLLDSVSFGDLARHPYFGYETARLITRYRTLSGVPLTLGSMVSRNVITPQQAERMAPYVRPSAKAVGNDYEFISSKVLK